MILWGKNNHNEDYQGHWKEIYQNIVSNYGINMGNFSYLLSTFSMLYIKINYFLKIIYLKNYRFEVAKIIQKVLCIPHPASPHGNILYNYSTISKL